VHNHNALHTTQNLGTKLNSKKRSKQKRMASKSIVTLGFGFLFFLSYWCCLVMSHCFVFVLIMSASSNGDNKGKIWSSYMGGKQLLHYEKLSWGSLLLGLFWWSVLVVQSNASLFATRALIENISCWGNLVIPTIWDHQIASDTDGGGGSPQIPLRETHRENFGNRTSIL
jgi:hypothetical protein